MQLNVLNKEGQSTGRSVNLPEDIFGITPNDHLIYMAVRQFRNAQRHGNHKVKTRAEVHGSSKKLHRQKGTGGSRKGNLRNPLYKGGGAVHGPEPHMYTFKMNKKEKNLARLSALAHKALSSNIRVVENFELASPKTKEIATMLNHLELTGKKVLYILDENNDNLNLSARNIPRVNVRYLDEINTYDIVYANTLVFTENAVKAIESETELEEQN